MNENVNNKNWCSHLTLTGRWPHVVSCQICMDVQSWNCLKSNLDNRYLYNILWGMLEDLRSPLKLLVYLLDQLSQWLQKWPQACAHFWLKPMVFLLPANISRQPCFQLHSIILHANTSHQLPELSCIIHLCVMYIHCAANLHGKMLHCTLLNIAL